MVKQKKMRKKYKKEDKSEEGTKRKGKNSRTELIR